MAHAQQKVNPTKATDAKTDADYPKGLPSTGSHKVGRFHAEAASLGPVTVCRRCQHPAVASAAICLHCGTPNPVTIGRAGNAAALFAGVLVFAAILAVLFLVL